LKRELQEIRTGKSYYNITDEAKRFIGIVYEKERGCKKKKNGRETSRKRRGNNLKTTSNPVYCILRKNAFWP
jgi:hypothetical protein